MQIKEKGAKNEDYIRYMKLIHINDTNIVLKSGNKQYNMTAEQFEKQCVWENGNDKHNFYILVVPDEPIDLSCSNTDLMLYRIWTQQNTILNNQISMAPGYMTLCATFLGCSLAVLAAGSYRLCDGCVSPTRQIVLTNVDEASKLLEHNHLQNTYTIETENIIPDRCCTKCRVSSSISVAGGLIALGSFVGLVHVYIDKIADENELKNLNEFTVPDPTNHT